MKSSIMRTTLLILFGATSAQGCSMSIPCGIQVDSIKLTDTSGTLLVTVSKYADCGGGFSGDPFEALGTATIEVDLSKDVVIADAKKIQAKPTKDAVSLRTTPKVNQPRININFVEGKRKIAVTKDNSFDYEYRLQGFEAPENQDMYEGVISFYSEKPRRLFFIYPKKEGKTGIASCKTAGKTRECVYKNTDINFRDIDKASNDIVVYDSINLVGLPVVCCLCVNMHYFEYVKKKVVRKISTLTAGGRTAIEIDSRTGVAYKASSSADGGIVIKSEPISSFDVTLSSAETKISKESLEGAFGNIVNL